MKKISISLLFLVFSCVVISQNKINGIVLAAENNQPLAFVTIIINNNPKLGTVSDIDGKFELESKESITMLSFSYVGYEKKEIAYSGEAKISVALAATKVALNEVTVYASENPANRIIREVIKNKDKNNPEKLHSFTYRSYTKTVFDFKESATQKADTNAIATFLKGGHFFLMESVSDRKFMFPNSSEEVVIANRVSGFKHPNFASLATDLQPFSFYNDNITLLDIHYLNPIANGSLKKYNYRLEEEFYEANDTIFVISYQPKKGKNIEGLKGILHINSKGYAVQNVTATPFEKGKMDLTLQQKYQYVDTHWFPEQLNYVLETTSENALGVIANGRSYISEVVLEPTLKKKEFSIEKVRMAEDAAYKDSLFWNKNRQEQLNLKEKITYRVMDSLGEKMKLDNLLLLGQKLAEGKIPLGKIDLDLSKTLKYNRHEGFRLGTGIVTSDSFSKKIQLGAFAGYGLRDHEWKYGGFSEYEFSKRNDFRLGIAYQKELNEIGAYGLKSSQQKGLNLRNYLALYMDQIQNYSAYVTFRLLRYTTWKVKGDFYTVNPQYEAVLSNSYQGINEYKNAQVSVLLRWAPNEKIIQSFNRRVTIANSNPIFTFYFANGFKGFQESSLAYQKLEASVEQTFYSKNFGNTHYRFEAGTITKNVPLGLLFTGEGSYVEKYPYFIKDAFQTMRLYEFVSDSYAHLFLHHNFGSLLFKIKQFQPSVSLHHNMGWGNLRETNQQLQLPYITKEKLFVESGLQIDNILKVNYLDIGYLGFGGSMFYRYGAYGLPEFKDNIALKLSMTFTIK
ncbi:carboxypeptidase-like regulatory domain-containing protein [Flavobacterium jejuense]|uniref:Carboxypeptidase-like regulatory domain-containing protein n=1 Tax=Flavobacterium jejuense TaxID=1544455 RepID=A0ABX0INF8_9FLAO|nr:DUF5686 family protein [Flavobacterium jejuense]NHN24580.1 carboxypeptidase-like regulatory domain-containing protein [Flavobacterium jejuense]